jgi:hypothetical protein
MFEKFLRKTTLYLIHVLRKKSNKPNLNLTCKGSSHGLPWWLIKAEGSQLRRHGFKHYIFFLLNSKRK